MTRAKKPKPKKRGTRRKSVSRGTQPVAATVAGPPPASLAEFITPPRDPLEANAELHRMLVASAYHAATDPELSPRERRLEIRTITAAAAKLMPDARRYQAEQMIKSNLKQLEQKASERRGAKLEARTRRAAK